MDEMETPQGSGTMLPPPPETQESPFPKPRGATETERVQDQLRRQAGIEPQRVPPTTGHLMSDAVLVVNQKAKVIELAAEYRVFDVNGVAIGSVAEIGQTNLRKAVRLLTSFDQYLTHVYEIRDAAGAPVMRLTRPAKLIKSKFSIAAADGTPIGEVIQKNVFGKISFGILIGGQVQATLNAEN